MRSDDPNEVGEGHSRAGRAGWDKGQWCRRLQMRQEKRGQGLWDRGTQNRPTHRSPPNLADHWALEDDPDMDVRTVFEVVGVEERQDENPRCGDACDSLFH